MKAAVQHNPLFTWKPLVNKSLNDSTASTEGKEWANTLYDTFVTSTPNPELKKTALNYGNLLFNDSCPATSDSHWIKIKAVGNRLLSLLEQEGIHSPLQKDFKDAIKADVSESIALLSDHANPSRFLKKRKLNA